MSMAIKYRMMKKAKGGAVEHPEDTRRKREEERTRNTNPNPSKKPSDPIVIGHDHRGPIYQKKEYKHTDPSEYAKGGKVCAPDCPGCEMCHGGKMAEGGEFEKKHPYAASDSEEHHSEGDRDAATKTAQELRANGQHATIWHMDGPKSGPKSKYHVRVPKRMADGGDVTGVHKPRNYSVTKEEVPTLRPEHNEGESLAGAHARAGYAHHAKTLHEDKLSELKGMKGKDRKYLADGGNVEPSADPTPNPKVKAFMDSFSKSFVGGGADDDEDEQKKAHGGEMHNYAHNDDLDMIGHIMKKRAHMYSKGGKVANESGPTADFDDNNFDDLVLRDDLEEHETGANSGDELGDAQEDADRRDIVSQIMKSRKKKDRNPSPA